MKQRRHALPTLALATCMVLQTGCATTRGPVSETMDPLTAVTATFSNSPLIVYRDTPSRAAFSKQYVSIGPIEINKSGDYQYFLWLGIWTTLQTNDAGELQDGFDSVVLIANGEPLLLDIVGWTPASINTSVPVYPKPFASSLDAYYRVTADQIRLITQADDLLLRTTGSSPIEFALWGDQQTARQDLDAFLDRILIQ